MGFSGRIEDLPVLDVFQYLHAGSKSGTLKLTRDNELAYVYFQKGNIIHAVSPQRSNIGDLLIENKDISLKILQKALVLQTDQSKEKPVGQILVEMGAISQERLKQVVLRQIEQVIYHLVSWVEGEFTFGPNEMIPVDDINLNPTTILPMSNINTQYLLLEAVRVLDEKNKSGRTGSGKSPEASSSSPHPAEQSPRSEESAGKSSLKLAAQAMPGSMAHTRSKPAEAQRARVEQQAVKAIETRWRVGKSAPILLVTDDGIFKNLLRDELLEKGLEVITPATVEDCLSKCGQYVNNGVFPLVLVEDHLPGKNRRRGAGTLILSERERSKWSMPVLILLSEMNQEAVLDLYKAGARAVFPKPVRESLKEVPYTAAIKSFGEIVPSMMRQLRDESAGRNPVAPCQRGICDELLMSKQALYRIAKERNRASIPNEILRIVSESMQRAVLFLIKGEELIGLAAFGDTIEGKPLSPVVKNMRVPLAKPSLFRQCVNDAVPFRGHIKNGTVPAEFNQAVGLPVSGQGIILPLLSMGQTVALLYCDQGKLGKDMNPCEVLEIVASQAGLALENAQLKGP